VLDQYRVYARVSPEHKVRIVKAWKSRDKVVAMTGDGVNDAPALKIADIGIGMGITGTDVSKGVSDMLLSDDNFATIVSAVEEGRKIYKNIRKAVQFLLSSNISEVLSLFVATLILPSGVLFLGPIHILWINLVTDAFPAIGLGMDQTEEGLMKEAPRNTKKSFFADGLGLNIAYQGMLLSIITLCAYFFGRTFSDEVATSMAFVTLSTVQLVHSFNMKSQYGTVFTRKIFSNPMLLFGAAFPMILLLLIINIPFLSEIFKVVALNGEQWMVCLILSFSIIPCVEIVKAIQRQIRKA
ncbi:MAG: cation-transporting P-type ATPase, partial [Vallitaleaceae bacterium]|nr:cation-transporting P-type ATPase [Vallitaleaceae bacterium]